MNLQNVKILLGWKKALRVNRNYRSLLYILKNSIFRNNYLECHEGLIKKYDSF